MDNPSLVRTISKLAAAGEQAGFTLEQMIDLLDQGLEVESLLELIAASSNNNSIPSNRVAIPLGRLSNKDSQCPVAR